MYRSSHYLRILLELYTSSVLWKNKTSQSFNASTNLCSYTKSVFLINSFKDNSPSSNKVYRKRTRTKRGKNPQISPPVHHIKTELPNETFTTTKRTISAVCCSTRILQIPGGRIQENLRVLQTSLIPGRGKDLKLRA